MLLDTSGLFCFLSANEPQHLSAIQLITDASSPLVTHNCVLAELIALAIVRRFSRETVLSFALELLDNPNVDIIWIDKTLHRQGMALLAARQDKTYSLCDAISFVVMRNRGIREALTTDKHFEQEGFTRLLL